MRDANDTLSTLTTSLKKLLSQLPEADRQLLSSFLSILYAKSMVAQGYAAVLAPLLAGMNAEQRPSIRLSKGKIRDLSTISSMTLEAIQDLSEAIGGTDLDLGRLKNGSLSCSSSASTKKKSQTSLASLHLESAKDSGELGLN